MVENPKTILLKGKQFTVHKEAIAAGTITPGMLVYRDTNSKFAFHATAAGNVVPMFALENDIFAKGIDDNYAANDQVIAALPPRGGEIYALLKASSTAVVVGDFLESGGDGTLRKHVPQAVAEAGSGSYNINTNQIVARALEAITPGGSPTRCRVEVV